MLRETTERPEAIEAGTAKLIGTNPKNIFEQVNSLIESEEEYNKMAKKNNPFGDGKASQRIYDRCKDFLKI